MSLKTNWGYILTEADELTDILTKDEYDDFTANKYVSDIRVSANITAVSAAIRNYCGWHVYPLERCQYEATFYDKGVSESFGCVLIQLPATYIGEIESVTVGDTECTEYILESNGILRLLDVGIIYKYTPIVVTYTAGIPDALMGALKELSAHRVTHALASSSGVQSETAGGVSVTYNATWTNNSRSTALADDNKEVLQPYRIQGVF